MAEENLKTLEQSLVDILTKTIDGVEKGTEFLMAEFPDVISQLMLWHGVKNFIFFIMSIFFLLSPFIFYFIVNKIRKRCELEWDDEGPYYMCLVAGLVSVITIATGFFLINLTWLQIWLAPKVWLIEYAASLVK